MEAWAKLIEASASLLWPVVAFIFLIMFREQVGNLLGRVKKGKVLGQEIEFEESLRELNISANKAVADATAISINVESNNEKSINEEAGCIREILDEVSRSKKAGLILLASEIEKQVRLHWAISGLINSESYGTIQDAINKMTNRGSIPQSVGSSLKLFWQVRNKIVHGREDDKNIFSAIDSGIHVLRAIKAIPSEKHTVFHPGVDVYQDQGGSEVKEGVKGVIISSESPGGVQSRRSIFPTTMNKFKKRQVVSWEWNMKKSFPKSWYRDPDTGKVQLAWDSSAEFIGRPLEEI